MPKLQKYIDNRIDGSIDTVSFYDSEGLKSGTHRKYYTNGRISCISRYKDGELDGPRISYFINGKRDWIKYYKNGHLHGLRIEYSVEGRKVFEGKVHYGMNIGLWVVYGRGKVKQKHYYLI